MLTGEEIYSWVKGLPIVDWHNHLDIRAIAEDRPFGSLYEVWVKADPYKHRAMRICGVPERLITGDAPEAEKWAAWNATLPKLVGNPLYVWSQAELKFLESHPLESLTPQKMLRAFDVAYTSPCVTAQEIDAIAAECRRLPADLPAPVAPGLVEHRGRSLPCGLEGPVGIGIVPHHAEIVAVVAEAAADHASGLEAVDKFVEIPALVRSEAAHVEPQFGDGTVI